MTKLDWKDFKISLEIVIVRVDALGLLQDANLTHKYT